MKLKVIQINIYAGMYFDNLVKFLISQTPDIVFAQEVSAGRSNRYKDKGADLFELLTKETGLFGVFANVVKYRRWPEAKFGNAVLSKFPIKKSKVIKLKEFRQVFYQEIEGKFANKYRPLLPRNLLDAIIDINDRPLHAISIHGAWTAPPTDTSENVRQAKIIADYLETLGEPFIMGGDLNMPPGTKVVEIISEAANNWMTDSGISQTTHPKIHKIVPRGFLVDYIFSSRDFKLLSIEAPEVVVSDHLPVVAELEF